MLNGLSQQRGLAGPQMSFAGSLPPSGLCGQTTSRKTSLLFTPLCFPRAVHAGLWFRLRIRSMVQAAYAGLRFRLCMQVYGLGCVCRSTVQAVYAGIWFIQRTTEQSSDLPCTGSFTHLLAHVICPTGHESGSQSVVPLWQFVRNANFQDPPPQTESETLRLSNPCLTKTSR